MTGWTHEKDQALLRWHKVGLANVGDPSWRPSRAEMATRLDHLTRSGARLTYARARVELGVSELASPRCTGGFDREVITDEIAYWLAEIEECAPARPGLRDSISGFLSARFRLSAQR